MKFDALFFGTTNTQVDKYFSSLAIIIVRLIASSPAIHPPDTTDISFSSSPSSSFSSNGNGSSFLMGIHWSG